MAADRSSMHELMYGFAPGSVVPERIYGCKGTIDETVVREKYRRLTLGLIENKLQVTTMESYTSGQVASLLTDTEGSSAVVCAYKAAVQSVPVKPYGKIKITNPHFRQGLVTLICSLYLSGTIT